jgi:hypothetical protein
MSFANVGFTGTTLAAAAEFAIHTVKAAARNPAVFEDDVIQKK